MNALQIRGAKWASLSLLLLFAASGCSSTPPSATVPPTSQGTKAISTGTVFSNIYTLLDTSFNLTTISTSSKYIVKQTGATAFGKSNVTVVEHLRAANTSGMFGIDPDTSTIIFAVEPNGDISYADSNVFYGWKVLPIASKTTTKIPTGDTTSDGTGDLLTGTIHYVGSTSIVVGGQTVTAITCQQVSNKKTYYSSVLERSQDDLETITFSPDLGFIISDADDMTITGAVGDIQKGGYQESISSVATK